MKIVYWNIFKLGSGKLKNKLNQGVIANAGLGNNILDYVVKVVSGNAVWNMATTAVPADVFIIIELVSGGQQKDTLGTGSCLRCLNAFKAALNNATNANKANYRYDFAPPRLIGYREVIGVLYNNKTLTYVSGQSMRRTAGTFINPRTAFWARFTVNNTLPLRNFNIIGIHGPTSSPQTSDYKDSVVFTNDLADIAQIDQSGLPAAQDTLIGGDYNCDPLNTYWSGNGVKRKKVPAFNRLTASYSYQITLPNGTKTSLRDAIAGGQYLSQPYDNIVFRLPSRVAPWPVVQRVDLIANAPIANTVALFNAARKVSDHLPVTVEW